MIIEHVALWVRDLESMMRFYAELLGGESGGLYENQDTGFRSYFLAFGDGARLELMSQEELGPAPSATCLGYAHIAFRLGSREAVDGAAEALATQGVVVESFPRVTGDGYYEAVVLDPEGNRVELSA
jgi:lactoylglutathione lyase